MSGSYTAQQRRDDLALYLEGPSAFWLRPDRGDYSEPCWMIEEPYTLPGTGARGTTIMQNLRGYTTISTTVLRPYSVSKEKIHES